MAMPRRLVDRLGLFDERFGAGSRIPGGEDTDYIYRAYLAGVTISYVPDIVVNHFHGRKKPAEGRNLFCNYAYGWGALNAKYFLSYPYLCRPFIWDIKNAIKEILTQKNTFLPNIGFSHRDKVYHSIIGSIKYIVISLFHIR